MRHHVIAVAALAAMVSGCDRRRDPNNPYGRQVEQAIPVIEKETGLKFKTPPKLEMKTRDEVRQYLLAKFNEDTPSEQLRGEEMAYKAFGLIPDTLQLRPFLIDLLSEQVLGYYDPSTKVLYVVKDAPDDMASVTVTHELVHALQDQHLSLDTLQKMKGNTDRQAALQAVIEGQAMWVQMKAALGGADLATRLPGGWDQVRQQIREMQASMPRFSNAPMAIQESLIFPYLSGAEFVRRFDLRKDTRSPLSALPQSTEQVLSESAFFDDPPDVPTDVTLPGRVRASEHEEVLGQFGTRLFLMQHGKDVNAAVTAAQGWDGDRFRVSTVNGKLAIVWATVWDTPLDAAQFVDAVGQAMLRRYRAGAPSSTSGGARTYLGGGRHVTITQREIKGRDVVVFVDVPMGASPTLIDPARITLGNR